MPRATGTSVLMFSLWVLCCAKICILYYQCNLCNDLHTRVVSRSILLRIVHTKKGIELSHAVSSSTPQLHGLLPHFDSLGEKYPSA